ncbi:MAG: M1 family metallopeptidase [Patescibacteria group bacterium]
MKKTSNNSNPYRLSGNVKPVLYKIALRLNFKDFTFSGEEVIDVKIAEETKEITLHALDLEIDNVSVRQNNEEEQEPYQISFNKKFETVTFKFENVVYSGDAGIKLNFKGALNDKLHGFYRTSYEVDGKKMWGASTHFEATDARRAFPCFDEPALKAEFSVDITVPEEYTALSNMPAKRESINSGFKNILFFKTPVMSTYLLVFVVAHLESIEAKDKNGVPVRVWTMSGKKEQGRFALQVALHTLPYFGEWFGIRYNLPKLDMAALPDFAAGAMENWGLITFRETALLIDSKNSSVAAKQRVAEVIDHELAHQWFGNLTTMDWWSDLWLNEGFASYMGPKAVAHQFPEWDVWTQYVVDEFISALHDDAVRNTHAIEISVKDPHEIREVFDAISYSKGSVVCRMLEYYLTEDAFRGGLRLYLERYRYGNAKTTDLWEVLEEYSGKPVKEIMASYTRQPGYPIITVHKKDNGKLRVEQKRFFFNGKQDKQELLWKVPVGFISSGASAPVFTYLKKRKGVIKIDLVGKSSWVKANPGQSGFYRAHYPAEMWHDLVGAMSKTGNEALSAADKIGFIDDSIALARAGYIKTPLLFELFETCRNETDFNVWSAIAGGMSAIDDLISGEEFHPSFKNFGMLVFREIASTIGWEAAREDGHLRILLRSLALRHCGGYGHEEIINEAKKRFSDFTGKEDFDPNLRHVVYGLVAENGSEEEFEKLLALYRMTDLQEEKNRLLNALGSFRKKELSQRALDFSISDEVRRQDSPFFLMRIGFNPAARELAWEFLKSNWKLLVERHHGGGFGSMTRGLEVIAGGLRALSHFDDVKEFFRVNKVPGIERAVKKSLERIRSNHEWLKRDRKDIEEWLKLKK